MASTGSKVKSIVLAASAAVIAATGAFYGASLKTQTERKQVESLLVYDT